MVAQVLDRHGDSVVSCGLITGTGSGGWGDGAVSQVLAVQTYVRFQNPVRKLDMAEDTSNPYTEVGRQGRSWCSLVSQPTPLSALGQ